MLHQPPQFLTAVQGLLLSQKCAVASGTAGEHLCFIGAGREEEDKYLHMVVSFFLQRGTRLVCVARGGYAALHDLLVHDLTCLADHDPKACLVCTPPPPSPSPPPPPPQHGLHQSQPPSLHLSANGRPGDSLPSNHSVSTSGLTNRLSSFSSVFKSRSAEMKERLIDYITNPSNDYPTATTTTTTATTTAAATTAGARHVSPQDKGKLYRQGDVFSIEDEEEDNQEEEGKGRGRREGGEEEENESLEKVDIKELLKKKEVVAYFPCQQVKENGYLLKSVLVLTDSLLLVIRESGTRQPVGRLAASRSLASIIKITSKKCHPDLITFKYGSAAETDPAADSEGDAGAAVELIVSDMDRFVIPNASRATKAIKEQILKQMEAARG